MQQSGGFGLPFFWFYRPVNKQRPATKGLLSTRPVLLRSYREGSRYSNFVSDSLRFSDPAASGARPPESNPFVAVPGQQPLLGKRQQRTSFDIPWTLTIASPITSHPSSSWGEGREGVFRWLQNRRNKGVRDEILCMRAPCPWMQREPPGSAFTPSSMDGDHRQRVNWRGR